MIKFIMKLLILKQVKHLTHNSDYLHIHKISRIIEERFMNMKQKGKIEKNINEFINELRYLTYYFYMKYNPWSENIHYITILPPWLQDDDYKKLIKYLNAFLQQSKKIKQYTTKYITTPIELKDIPIEYFVNSIISPSF